MISSTQITNWKGGGRGEIRALIGSSGTYLCQVTKDGEGTMCGLICDMRFVCLFTSVALMWDGGADMGQRGKAKNLRIHVPSLTSLFSLFIPSFFHPHSHSLFSFSLSLANPNSPKHTSLSPSLSHLVPQKTPTRPHTHTHTLYYLHKHKQLSYLDNNWTT